MRRSIYTLATVAGLCATNAQAQTYYYDLDSSFSSTGVKVMTAGTNHASVLSCLLLNDGKSFNSSLVTDVIGSVTALEVDAKLKLNGDFDSVLCGSYCTSGVPITSTTTGIYDLSTSTSANYYFASTGFGGQVLIGSGATAFDEQRYSTGFDVCKASAKYNDTIVVMGGVEGTSGIIYAYKVNAASSGYGGAPGIITDGLYPHGGPVATFTPSIFTVGVQHVGVQSSKKILAAGFVRYMSVTDTGAFICRFKLNSMALDSTFGTNGIVYIGPTPSTPIKVNAFYVGADDKIYVQCTDAGSPNTFIKVYAANGTPLTTFGTGGTLNTGTTVFNKMRIVDNRLICGLKDHATGDIAWSYNLDGTTDTTFGISTNALNISSRYSGSSAFSTNDISYNSANEIMLGGHYMNASGKLTGTVIKLKKKLKPIVEPPTSVAAITTTNVTIAPNPTNGNVRIDVPTASEKLKVQVSTITGAVMLQEEISNRATIDMAHLPAGIYMLHINDGQGIHHARVVKH